MKKPFDPSIGPLSHETTPAGRERLSKRCIIEFTFLVFVIAQLIHYGNSPVIDTFSVTFVAIVLEALPFLLFGSLLSGFLEEFVSHERLSRVLVEGRKRTVFLAAALGIVFPICECAIVPVIRRLLQKGVPLSAAIAFLLAGPIVNPIVFGSTAVAYGLDWETAAIRVLCGYVIATWVGFAVGRMFGSPQAFLSRSELLLCAEHPKGDEHDAERPFRQKFWRALAHGGDDFLDMASFLIMGAFMAALFQSVVDRRFFFALAENPNLAIILMMALAMILSICSEADAFVAASFQLSLPLSAQMAFMVIGPMLDLKLLVMYLGVFKKKAVLILPGMTIASVLAVMLLFQLFIGWVLS
jgi:uncharacterized membrane protein YraQ (UPF0718 family)